MFGFPTADMGHPARLHNILVRQLPVASRQGTKNSGLFRKRRCHPLFRGLIGLFLASTTPALAAPSSLVQSQDFASNIVVSPSDHVVLPGDDGQTWRHRYFLTSDKTNLHYIEAGDAHKPTLVFVPGWTMPAAIWAPQINAFAHNYHVIAFDPRGQGESDIPTAGYTHERRTQDLAELIVHLGRRPIILVGWSLGVLETLSFVSKNDSSFIKGLILIDNSVGEGPAPGTAPKLPSQRSSISRVAPRPPSGCTVDFVKAMFRSPKSSEYISALAKSCGRIPPEKSAALLRFKEPRSQWREALYAFRKPVLYLVTPRWKVQADLVAERHVAAKSVIVENSGHAIFIDKSEFVIQEIGKFVEDLGWGKSSEY